MIIDFHTHCFPDKIASTTVAALEKASGNASYADGTKAGLNAATERANATYSVNLPVLTKPSQFDSVLDFAQKINEERGNIISFAGIHPLCDDIRGKMKKIKDAGIKGVKIHPDYQDAFIDGDNCVEIIKTAKDNDLIVVTHAGIDEGFLTCTHCTPDRILNLLKIVGGYDKLVLAHLGSNRMFDEVYEKLAGKSVYFDTAYSLPLVTTEQFKSLVEKHGADKILFATDSPWRDIKSEVERLKSYNLTPETQDKIFYKNAKKLLNI